MSEWAQIPITDGRWERMWIRMWIRDRGLGSLSGRSVWTREFVEPAEFFGLRPAHPLESENFKKRQAREKTDE